MHYNDIKETIPIYHKNGGIPMEIQRIKSFEIDHTILDPGFYISRVDGDITTFDLRTRKPNTDSLITPSCMHTLEHMFATFIRNSPIAADVVYFGPMGCQTGFYLLTRNRDPKEVFEQTKIVLEKILAYEGPVFGGSEVECGNYRTLNLQTAKDECGPYLEVLKKVTDFTFSYPKGDA